jgi:DNA-directed RNA polymerase subunit K/omega
MSKFEHTVVIAHRASQLSQGARPRAHCADGSQASLDLAAAELETGVIRGMRVGRYGPDGVVVQKEVERMHIARRRVRLW